MISILLEAKEIPDGTEVRKPTGAKVYFLKKSIPVYGDGLNPADKKKLTAERGVMFMMAEGSINCIPDTMKLAVDFETTEDAIEFLTDYGAEIEP